jgi:hypothetical protein
MARGVPPSVQLWGRVDIFLQGVDVTHLTPYSDETIQECEGPHGLSFASFIEGRRP